ncbi:MAG: HDOD domain-containing protein [Chromatiales bacterium]|nr:HDOD domain-containing protein [Chromatiales bacterium]
MDGLTLDELLAEEAQLLTLPYMVVKLLSMTDDPDADLSELAELVGCDAVLSAKVLRIINSAYYALPKKIDSINTAVNLVGLRRLRELVLATQVGEIFKGIAAGSLNVRSFWENSYLAAILARDFAHALKLDEDRLFAVSLLHHLGIMVMLQRMPVQMARIIQQARADEQELQVQELAQLGYTHADVAAGLMAQWQLSDYFVEVCQYHHRFYQAPNHAADAAVIHLADVMAQEMSPLMSLQGLEDEADLAVYDYVTLAPSAVDSLARQALVERANAGMLLQ